MGNNILLRNTVIAGLFLVPLISFIIARSMLFPFISGKAFAFRILVELLFIPWIFLVFRDERYRPKFSWILVAVFAFIGVMGLATLFAENSFKSFWSNFERMEGYITLLHLCVYFLMISTVFQFEKVWNYFWYTFLGSGVVMSLYGVLQLSGAIAINQGGVRLDGTFGNSTYLAAFMLMLFFITLFLMVRKKISVWLWGILSVTQLVIIYFTATRGAILGLIGGLLLTALIVAIGNRENARLRKISLGVLGGIAIFILGFIGIKDAQFVQNSPVLSRFATLSVEEIRTQGRYFVWPMAVEGFKERPILGWGQENFSYVFNKNYDPRMYAQEQWFDRAHSIPLDWLIAGGIMGYITYFGLFVAALWVVWRRSEFSFVEKSVLTGFLGAYLFQNLFVFDNLLSYVLFFSLLGYLHTMNGKSSQKISSFFENSINARVVPVLVVILVVTSLYFANYKPIRAGQTLIDALITLQIEGPNATALDQFEKALSYNTFANAEIREQLATLAPSYFQEQVPFELRERYFNLTDSQYKIHLEHVPNDTRYRLFYGLFLARAGQDQRAIEEYEYALATSPEKQTIMFELGSVYLGRGEYEKANEIFKTAYELEPDFVTARIIYGTGLLYAGNDELAEEILSGVPREQRILDDRITNAYVTRGEYEPLVEIFSERLVLLPDDPQTNISLAVSYLRSGNRARSIEVMEDFLSRNPQYESDFRFYINEIRAGRDPSQQ